MERPKGDNAAFLADHADFFNSVHIENIPLPEFHRLSELIAENFGIKIGENKRTLLTGRLCPMMERYGFADYRACVDAIEADKTGNLLSELANSVSTNHTAFYREDAHFKYLLETVLPDLAARSDIARERDLRVWCAACATGEEAYTILFIMLKFFRQEYVNWRAGLLATDISATALEIARRGVYSRQRLEAVPKEILLPYFNPVDAENFEVKPELRREVTFRRLNLISDSYPFRQPFDIIFCRNVMIYFSRKVRQHLLNHLYECLRPGGYLFIGHSESMTGGFKGFQSLAPAVYRRVD